MDNVSAKIWRKDSPPAPSSDGPAPLNSRLGVNNTYFKEILSDFTYLLVQLKLIGCLWQQKHLQKYSFLIICVPDLQSQNCLNKVWTRFINYDFLTEKHCKLLLSSNKFESNGKIRKKCSTNLLSTYIIHNSVSVFNLPSQILFFLQNLHGGKLFRFLHK